MLQYKAVTYTNRNTPLTITDNTLPVTVKNDGTYDLDTKKILIKVKLAALNPVDGLLRNTAVPVLFRAKKGYGFDYSGEVVAIGPQAASQTGLSAGDAVSGMFMLVFGMGTLSEFLLVNPFKESGACILKKPEKLSFEEAAAYPLVFGTARDMFKYGEQKSSTFKKTLVIGAGTSVGRYVVQLAKQLYNSEEIVVTCSSASESILRELGATLVIDYKVHKSALNPTLESVKESGKFDAIFDCCGNGDLFSEINEIIKPKKEGGAYVTIVGDKKARFEASAFGLVLLNSTSFFREIASKLGFLLYNYGRVMLMASEENAKTLASYFQKFDIKVFVDSVYPFEKFQEAIDRVTSNKARGKVVVNVQ